MDFNIYQQGAAKTAIYTGQGTLVGLFYTVLGLAGEAGEVANKVSKILRDDDGVLTIERQEQLEKELGDVLWFLSQTCTELQMKMGVVASLNLEKLNARKEAGTLQGSGDNRESASTAEINSLLEMVDQIDEEDPFGSQD